MSINKKGINDTLMEATKNLGDPKKCLELLSGAKQLLLESKDDNAKSYAKKIDDLMRTLKKVDWDPVEIKSRILREILDIANEIKHKNIEG